MALARTLGFRDTVLILVGTVIGSGVFLVPGPVLRYVHGNVLLALVVWLAGGLLSFLGALTYAELSAFRPAAGGLYVYIRDCFGSLAAFLYGWTLFALIGSGSMATLAVGFGLYFNQIVPIGALGMKLVAVGMIAITTVINILGTRKGANVQNLTTGLKVAALLVLGVTLLAIGPHRAAMFTSPISNQSGSLAVGFGLAMISVLWAFEGWQYCTFTAGETKDPQRNLPRALVSGSILLLIIYLLANFGYLAALGPANAAAANSIAAIAAQAVLGPAASYIISLIILTSMFSATNGMMLTTPRVYYAMAEDGVFFRKLAEIHPRFQTPAFAILSGSVWSSVLALSGSFEQLLTYVVFSGWLFYALGAAAVFVYRRKFPDEPRPFRVPGYPWVPAMFIITAGWLVLNTVAARPSDAALGLLLVFSGFPAYLIWRRSSTRALKTLDPVLTAAKPPE